MSQPKTSPGQWPGHTGEAGKVVAFDPEGPGQSQDLLVMPADQNVRVREPGVVPEVPGEGLELLDFEVRVDGQTGRRDQRRESKRRAFALGRVGRREEVVEPERVAPALASRLEVPEVPDVGLGAGLA